MNKKKIALVIVLFLTVLVLILPIVISKHILVFDTLREFSNMEQYFIKDKTSLYIDWFMYELNGTVMVITNIDPFDIHLYGGAIVLIITTLFIYLIFREINSKLAAIFTLMFILGLDIASTAFYYRPQTIALFIIVFFVYIITKAIKNQEIQTPYVIISFIISLIAINAHKVTKIIPILFILFWGLYLLLKKRFTKDIILIITAAIILVISMIYYFVPFINFYLNVGSEIDPAAFSKTPPKISDFTSLFGIHTIIILVLMCLYFIFKFIKKEPCHKNEKINTHLFISYLILLFIFLLPSYILPMTGLFSANPDRFNIFIYPMIIILIALFLNIFTKEFNLNKYLVIFFIIFITVFYCVPNFEELNKKTTDKSYFYHLSKLPLETEDIIITTFTASPALLSAQEINRNYSRYDTITISGYHYWGPDLNQTLKTRELFRLKNEIDFNLQICNIIKSEQELIEKTPVFPEFIAPSEEEKQNIINILKNKKRILILISKYDQNLRIDKISKSAEINKWWEVRTSLVENENELLRFKNSEIIINDKDVLLIKYNISCEMKI